MVKISCDECGAVIDKNDQGLKNLNQTSEDPGVSISLDKLAVTLRVHIRTSLIPKTHGGHADLCPRCIWQHLIDEVQAH